MPIFQSHSSPGLRRGRHPWSRLQDLPQRTRGTSRLRRNTGSNASQTTFRSRGGHLWHRSNPLSSRFRRLSARSGLESPRHLDHDLYTWVQTVHLKSATIRDSAQQVLSPLRMRGLIASSLLLAADIQTPTPSCPLPFPRMSRRIDPAQVTSLSYHRGSPHLEPIRCQSLVQSLSRPTKAPSLTLPEPTESTPLLQSTEGLPFRLPTRAQLSVLLN